LFRSIALERQGYYDSRPGGPPRLSYWQRRVRGIVEAILDARLREAPPPRRLLDAGCGRGDFSLALARRYPALEEVVGCDASTELIELARSGSTGEPRVRFEVGELIRLPLEPASMDVAVCVNVLHHVRREQLAAALAELARVCARTLVVEIKNARSPYFRLHSRRVEGVPIFPLAVGDVAEGLRPCGFELSSRHPIFGWEWLSPLVVLRFERAAQRK
jgi:ubiquinone/menaquinone biosynthesis C-methylase UbiE